MFLAKRLWRRTTYESARGAQTLRTIWLEADGSTVGAIDQTLLPHRFATIRLATLDRRRARDHDHAGARRAVDRGGGRLRGRAGHARRCLGRAMERAYAALLATRPTAINLNGRSTR